MPSRHPWIWVVTVLVLVAGGIAIFGAVGWEVWERSRQMEGVGTGVPAQQATEVIGVPPARCPAGSLEHLRSSFPEGWTTAAVDVAIEQLRERTVERWIYPIGGRGTDPCAGEDERTEVGVASDGTVVWSVAVFGRSELRLPSDVTPAGTEALVEDST